MENENKISDGKSQNRITPYVICLVIAVLFFISGYIFCLTFSPNRVAIIQQDNANAKTVNAGESLAESNALDGEGQTVPKSGNIRGIIQSVVEDTIFIQDPATNSVVPLIVTKDTKFVHTIIANNKTVFEPINRPNFKVGEFVYVSFKDSTIEQINYNPNPHN